MTIYTLGYGRTTKEEFVERYKSLELPAHEVFDVRARPGSRNGKWAYAGENMQAFFKEDLDVTYHWVQMLGNRYGKKGLWWYCRIMHDSYAYKALANHQILFGVPRIIMQPTNAHSPLLLCSERKAVDDNGLPLCHRAILAHWLSKDFSAEVIHL